MSRFSFKIAVCAVSFVGSGLLAVDAAQLGRDIVTHTMYGIIDVLRNDQHRAEISRRNVACCIASARRMNQDWQKKHFLQTGIDTLKNIDVRRFGQGCCSEQLLHLALSKYVGIEILAAALNRGADSGFLCRTTDTLFCGMPFYCEYEESQAIARAAIDACHEVGVPCYESDLQIAEVLRNPFIYGYEGYDCCSRSFSIAAGIAIDLYRGEFGDRIAPFLVGAKMFVAA